MKKNAIAKPATKLFARRLGPNGWVYDDKSEHAFALACAVLGFDLLSFDAFLETADWKSPDAQTNLQWLVKRRSEAMAAFKEKKLRLMRSVLETLLAYRELIETDEALRPKARHGSKFIAKKVGASGPVRKAIARVLRNNPKLSADEVWTTLEISPPRNLEFYGTSAARRYIRRAGHPDTGWRRFQNIVSEVKRQFKP